MEKFIHTGIKRQLLQPIKIIPTEKDHQKKLQPGENIEPAIQRSQRDNTLTRCQKQPTKKNKNLKQHTCINLTIFQINTS